MLYSHGNILNSISSALSLKHLHHQASAQVTRWSSANCCLNTSQLCAAATPDPALKLHLSQHIQHKPLSPLTCVYTRNRTRHIRKKVNRKAKSNRLEKLRLLKLKEINKCGLLPGQRIVKLLQNCAHKTTPTPLTSLKVLLSKKNLKKYKTTSEIKSATSKKVSSCVSKQKGLFNTALLWTSYVNIASGEDISPSKMWY